MRNGNRNGAVDAWNRCKITAVGPATWREKILLELAMSLETVDRTDDARRIYGKLAATSWSPTIKRNAHLQLISGLDITKQNQNDVRPTQRSAMDVEGMNKISEALEAGLSNGWDDWGKTDKRNKMARPWFDDGKQREGQYTKVDTFRDAYFLVEEALDPLRSDRIRAVAL